MDCSPAAIDSTMVQRGNSLLVEARLQGGAPWGFTLKGGLEHGEPLIISKVEEDGKARLLQYPLLVGDEVVVINGVELSGFRQEAISLVKGSYKTLHLTVRREGCAGLCCSEPHPLPLSSGQRTRKDRCTGGVQLRIKQRRSEPGSRPHSWHSAKLGEGPLVPDSMMQISQGAVGAPWHQSYHSSASTTDLSSYEAGFLRKSPDQYSSRGSMESLDHTHPAYSSCNQLSASKSSNSIDHLHSKRDSAYSSFSTSSSIPEYLAAAPSFTKERSYSMESVPQHKIAEGMQQADIRYVRTIYDTQQGVSEEHEVSSAALQKTRESRAQSRSGSSQGGVCHRANSSGTGISSGGTSTSHRHSVGPVWGQSHNSYENLKGAPAPPLRSDSYAAIRNHERPNSWSSLEQARSLRALHKGSWHHSSGSVASGKSSFGVEGQLHTVIEKSPESSPTIKPKQSFPSALQSGRAMLPTSVYPVPQPEPHFAQIPTNNPSSSSVYPALAKESKHAPKREPSGVSETGVRAAVENGYQSIASYSSTVQPHATQPKQSSQVEDDPQAKYGFYKSHLQPQGHTPPASSLGQERRDPFTPVQPRRDRPRYSHGMDIMETYRQPREEEQSKCPEQNVHLQSVHTPFAQGQVSQPQKANTAQAQASEQRISSAGRFNSDSTPYQQNDQDLDHPLTRLENALAEVQRCASPQSTSSQCSFQSKRSMSVLEKVSHFERQQTKPRSHSCLSNYSSSARPHQAVRSAKTTPCGLEDLQNAFPQERSRSASAIASHEGSMEAQDLQPKYGSTDQAQHRKPHDLHRSKSSFQLGEENGKDLHRSKSTFQLGEENGRDVPWKDDIQDILGTIQDTSFNRAYRDSIKDAQSKVLRSTSFRRRDLNINPPPVPVKHMSLERKGPKMSPKPTISPHTPKERHVVPVEVADKTVPPELPSVPPVGPSVMRICGRKRLTMEQKKLSYSEPENIHEVGVYNQESSPFQRRAPQQFLLPETSVADRRRMFELAASRSADPKPATSRTDLKQMQQDALAEYVERKTGRRIDGRPHRPLSAYMQSASSMDTQSLTSTPSLCSLQEPGLESISVINLQPSAFTANKLRSYYPNRGTQAQPQPEIYQPDHRPHGQTTEPQKPEKGPVSVQAPGLVLEPFHTDSASQSINAFFERGVATRCSGKSASAEDLLDRKADRPVSHHFRSRSTPVVEKYDQDFMARERTLLGLISKEPPDNRASGDEAPVREERGQLQDEGRSQPSVPAIRRDRQRLSERPRAHSATGLAASVGLPCPFSPAGSQPLCEAECQPNLDAIAFPGVIHENAKSSFGVSEIADDAGDCRGTLKSPGSRKTAAPETASDVSASHPEDKATGPQASLCFQPSPQPFHTGSPADPKSPASPTMSLPSLRISESNIQFAQPPDISQEDDEVFLATPSSLPTPLPIRETEITEDILPSPPPIVPQTKEEAQDLTPQEPQSVNSISDYQPELTSHQDNEEHFHDLSSPSVTPDSNWTPVGASMTRNGKTAPQCPERHVTEEQAEEEEEAAPENLGLESALLARRKRSVAEVHVEALARELLHRDEALALLLETWASTSTLDLMEGLFPSYFPSPRQQHSDSPCCLDERAPDVSGVADDSYEKTIKERKETNLDEEESDLNHKKGELLRALGESLAVLRAERAGLVERERHYRALGQDTEALVQQCCRPNEREKYCMFVGDQEKIVNLLLSLSGRRARVENALSALGNEPDQDSAEERASLQQKWQQLCNQQEDARELKENLDRRERVVLDFLAGYLSRAQLRNYQRYVRAKPALLIRQRHLDGLIRQGEEQLQRLSESMPPELRPPGLDPASSSADRPEGSNLPAHSPRPPTVTAL
ncbi:protein Shroom3 isoform X1 [Electrophorus electricus]|uniref:protein Shroom3 isoform X1 n=2 Tax=Electrophorus electricus TaxID=8005 RepID=UPI0015D02DE5|nr:protein Shroom3 isoform X1 [Electrophorus electricus]